MTARTSQEEDSKVSCHLLWTVVMRTNTEETSFTEKRTFARMHRVGTKWRRRHSA